MTPTIVALRERLGTILEGEVERSLAGRLRHLGPREREELLVIVEAAVERIVHPATRRLRRLAVEPRSRAHLEQTVSTLRDLFGLGEQR